LLFISLILFFILIYLLCYFFSSIFFFFCLRLCRDLFRFSLLPIIVGVIVSLAQTRASNRTFFLDEINQDYVRTARGEGNERDARDVGARAAANALDSDHHQSVMIQLPGLLRGRVSDRALLLRSPGSAGK